ncbi:hypothetical protein HWV62_32746 [Athelia sp. TMB]|nr:hypothetical protein HWV62_32746 [Athelia sp. TMB]
MIYKHHSPAVSTTSLSDDNEEDDANASTFFGTLVVSPAQWSRQSRPAILPQFRSHSPMSNLPPEILIHILKHLHSPRDLYNALRVSHSWCECSVELLWHRPSLTKVPTLVKMMQVLSRRDQTFTYARFIRRLNFLFLGSDLTDSLFSRLAQCDRLERLTLVNCAAISEEPLARVLPRLSNLVAIDLTGVAECTDKAIVGLANAARRLQGINLAGCKKVSDVGIMALARNCPLLRRVKLSNVELITDDPVSALAEQCPLLLEIDLNHCKLITDRSVRSIWLHSSHMREMRLAHCVNLTDAAFPAPPRDIAHNINNDPFPASSTKLAEDLPPLVLHKQFDHLRMLDLTACDLITDDAVEGIIAYSPKIRNIVFSKCTKLTDRSVENICKLGKHLHYLHLGHTARITDRSVKTLARCCTRLRYVDFANCVLLTDMSVHELCGLHKLRRIGLVRVNNLTDEAVYSLAERASTLERIHLSYCDQITVMAIHYLLDRLHKVTHLSLTGIPAFRQTELQQFCRPPPSDFNLSQRSAFCVYSGKGVSELRAYLTDLVNTMTQDMNPDDDTEYDDDYDDMGETTPDAEMETGNEEDDEDFERTPVHPNRPTSHTNFVSNSNLASFQTRSTPTQPNPTFLQQPDSTMHRDRTIRPLPTTSRSSTLASSSTAVPTTRRAATRAFGQQPVVETSNSPTPSDVASNRSTGTNQSNGVFFRTYQEAASASRSNGALTPELNFAEIGHGRGADNGTSGQVNFLSPARAMEAPQSFNAIAGPSVRSSNHGMHPPRAPVEEDRYTPMDTSPDVTPSNTSGSVAWPQLRGSTEAISQPTSSTARELHDSVHSALAIPAHEGRDTGEGRGRRVKRSLRNTINAAETFFFGRGGTSSAAQDENTGWNSGTDSRPPRR